MRAALGTIDFIQMLEGEFELRSQTFNPFTKVPFRKWRQLVEEWLDDSRVDKDHQDLEGEPERGCFSSRTKACSNWTGLQERH